MKVKDDLISMMCQLCGYNFQNEYCQANEREDTFIVNCGEFEFELFHLVDVLEKLKARE